MRHFSGSQGGRVHAGLANLIFRMDRRLQRRMQVFEYSADPRCVFRIRIVVLDAPLLLPGGVRLEAGERLVDLHLWNEQIPRMLPSGPTLGWARRMHSCLDLSFWALNGYLSARPDLADIRAVRADMSFATRRQVTQLTRLSRRFGFDVVPKERGNTFAKYLDVFIGNVVLSLLVFAANVRARRRDTLRRTRVLALASRQSLERRYGQLAPIDVLAAE